MKAFVENPVLNRVRLYTCPGMKHNKIRGSKTQGNPRGKYQCRLCYTPLKNVGVQQDKRRRQRQTVIFCDVCAIPLCTSPFRRDRPSKSCFESWHSCADLARERTRCQSMLQESYDRQQQQGVAEAKDDEDGNNEESAEEEDEKSGDEEDNGNNNNENDNDEREEEETPEIFQRRTRSMAPPKSANSSRQSVRRRIQTTPDS